VSLNRGFSAPVNLTLNSSADDQLFLMAHDSDSFNRWEAGQTRGRGLILAQLHGTSSPDGEVKFADALRRLLNDANSDDAFKSLMLGLPTENDIAAAIGHDVDTDAVLAARNHVRTALGRLLQPELESAWTSTAETGDYRPDPAGTARRALRYAALQLLLAADAPRGVPLAKAELHSSHSMSAEIGALSALVQVECAERETALDAFFDRHGLDPLLIDKWLMLNAQCTGTNAAARIEMLTRHPAFDWKTPNRVYALIAAFTSGNTAGFNAADGEGYRVVADAVLQVDRINPQVAARLATGFRSCKVLNADRRSKAQAHLDRILAESNLSRDCFEIVSRIASG
jgi:aminopeptidase N